MKTRIWILIVILIAGFSVVLLFTNNSSSENNIMMKSDAEILTEINDVATTYQKNDDKARFDEQMEIMQKKQKETASKILGVDISNAYVAEGWNFPFKESSEVTVIDPEFKEPICDIPEKIPVHLQKIRQSEMFQIFAGKYSQHDLTIDISDERNHRGWIHYNLGAISDDGLFSTYTHFHFDSCTNEMHGSYFLLCKDIKNDEHVSTSIKSEITSSLKNNEFCNIELEPWHQDLRDYHNRISDELYKLTQGEVPVDSDGNPSHRFFSDFGRLGLLNDIIRYYDSDNSDREKMQEDIAEYNRKFGSLPEELLKIIEKRK